MFAKGSHSSTDLFRRGLLLSSTVTYVSFCSLHTAYLIRSNSAEAILSRGKTSARTGAFPASKADAVVVVIIAINSSRNAAVLLTATLISHEATAIDPANKLRAIIATQHLMTGDYPTVSPHQHQHDGGQSPNGPGTVSDITAVTVSLNAQTPTEATPVYEHQQQMPLHGQTQEQKPDMHDHTNPASSQSNAEKGKGIRAQELEDSRQEGGDYCAKIAFFFLGFVLSLLFNVFACLFCCCCNGRDVPAGRRRMFLAGIVSGFITFIIICAVAAFLQRSDRLPFFWVTVSQYSILISSIRWLVTFLLHEYGKKLKDPSFGTSWCADKMRYSEN